MVAQLIRSVEAEQFKKDVPYFGAGDTVRVHAKVVEGNRERIQVFEGVVIRRRAGGINENFTVRRIASHGIGVERTFLIHSPRIEKIDVVRHGDVRRAKLYYLRGLTGRAARIKERRRPNMNLVAAGSVEDILAVEPVIEEIIPELAPEEMEASAAAATEATDVAAAEATEATETAEGSEKS